ncbi:MAG TPA: ABC transporter substrate-binding protein [Lachnospiraceae bacterium]|nr:ABC transporter substrate-binding protein [Lachnospiraceae bacterium]
MKRKIAATILSVCMVLGLAGCGADAQSQTGETVVTDEEAAEETVVTDEEAEEETAGAETEIEEETTEPVTIRLEGSNISTPNPFRHTTRGPGIFRTWLLYDSLLEKDENGDIPWLAKDWDVSEDGTVYTFYLEEDACWHDGEPLTAEDVAFTFDYYREHLPVYHSLLADGEYIVDKTEAIDDHTVEITLTHFDNTFLSSIGMARIIPKHIWENIEDPAAYDGEGVTVGSGPYMLDSYDAEQGAYRYVAFEDYWGLTPAAEAIEWVPVSDSVLAFENEEIDLLNASADLLSRYENDSQYTVKSVSSLHSFRLMMNMEAVPEFLDVNVRKAIAYAINCQELIDTVSRGAGTVSSMGYVPMESAWYNSDTVQYDYDPQKAEELLDGQTYSFKLLTDNSADSTKTAEMIKIYLAEVGIDVTIESVESKTRDNAITTGEYELLLNYIGGMGGDPDYLRDVYGQEAGTIRGWSNETVAELLTAQAVEQDTAAREEMIDEVQEIISDEVPMIMLYGKVVNYVYRQDKYDGWMCRYDHNMLDHNKLSYLIREE